MIIAVVSDTHRNGYIINKLKSKIKNADVIIHLGDNVQDIEGLSKDFKGILINVRGNCDFLSTAKSERLENILGKRVFITHGHKYGVKYELDELQERARELEADIVLYGHTHESKVDFIEGIWYINPGSPSMPRDGFPSYAVIEINENNINPTILSL